MINNTLYWYIVFFVTLVTVFLICLDYMGYKKTEQGTNLPPELISLVADLHKMKLSLDIAQSNYDLSKSNLDKYLASSKALPMRLNPKTR